MNDNFYVYCWTNNVNGKRYIGKGRRGRCNDHIRESTKKKPKGLLAKAMKKYGVENFTLTMCEEGLTEGEAFSAEIWYILRHGTKVPDGYNRTDGGEGMSGYKHSDETREKMSIAHRGEKNHNFGKTLSDETKMKLSIAKRGETFSEEHRAKIGNAHRGKTLSEETRAKIGAKSRGKTLSHEQREKIGAASRGRTPSEETRQKMSIAQRGRTLSEETKEKISLANRGRTLSEETREKMSIANRGKTLSDETREKIRGDLNGNSKKRRAVKTLLTFFHKLCT